MTDVDQLWQSIWHECMDEAIDRSPDFDPADYYTSGRASKAYPDKESPAWWADKGPEFVKMWVKWRDSSTLSIAEFPDSDGVLHPAIELECWARRDSQPLAIKADELIVRSFIDRVFVDSNNDHYIVDLKTGAQTPAWPQQLALNNLCLAHETGTWAKWGGYWKARSGGVEKWFDLSIYTEEWLWSQVAMAKAIRDQQLFVAQPTNLCNSACGVKQHCIAMGGTPFSN